MIRFMLVALLLLAYTLALAKIGGRLYERYDVDPLITFFVGFIVPALGVVGWVLLGSIW